MKNAPLQAAPPKDYTLFVGTDKTTVMATDNLFGDMAESSGQTPAEVRAARVLGADAVGMSTVPEAIAAAHCGYEILGVTLCSNMAAGVLPQPLSGEEVNEMAEQSAPHFSSLILGCLERL